MLVQVYPYTVDNGDGTKTTTYHTAEDGGGKLAARAVSAGGGKYYVTKWNKDDAEGILTDDDRVAIMSENFMFNMIGRMEQSLSRETGEPVVDDNGDPKMVLRGGKLVKLLQLFDNVIADVRKAQHGKLGNGYTKDNAENILGHVYERFEVLKQTLRQETSNAYDIAI